MPSQVSRKADGCELHAAFNKMCGEEWMGIYQIQVVTYNSAQYIVDCLNSILAQSLQAERILVIDNGSVDDTVTFVRQVNGVELIELPANNGYAAGHNTGFSLLMDTPIDFVVTVNPDILLDPYYVERCINLLDSQTNCGGVQGKLMRQTKISCVTGDQGAIDNAISMIDSVGLQMERFFHVRDRGSEAVDDGQFDHDGQVWGVCGAAAVYRTAMLKQLNEHMGTFNETFFLYKEDVELCFRAKRLDWTFSYCSTAKATHYRGWQEHSRIGMIARAHSFSNQIIILLKYAPRNSKVFIGSALVEMVRFFVMVFIHPKVAWLVIRLLRSKWRAEMKLIHEQSSDSNPVDAGQSSAIRW